MSDLYALYQKSSKILRSISSDEEEHRKLWLDTSDTLGLKYPTDFYRETLPETRDWIDAVNQRTDSYRMFAGFTAIEIIAEAISKYLLISDAFNKTLGKRGSRWFKVHVHPDDYAGATHEELAWRLAFAFYPATPSKESCNGIVQDIVDLFLKAADASRYIKLP